ncbi:MerR family DNA-binding protein [Pseudactinotalea sp.]|uniref:MerR family DNA-binding protein n=1 Tax=Pseudactinotalea sp. TaxID=1926260 RepID=UPI003B3A5C4C
MRDVNREMRSRSLAPGEVAHRAGVAVSAGRSPTKADWARLSRSWRTSLDDRIAQLERLRDTLDGCIGCGCLSMRSCTLANRGDKLSDHGPGPVRMLGRRTGPAE